MKTTTIKTDQYYLLLSDHVLKHHDWIFSDKSVRPVQLDETISVEYLAPGNWKKVIAHLPLNEAPALDGVSWLPQLPEQDLFIRHLNGNISAYKHELDSLQDDIQRAITLGKVKTLEYILSLYKEQNQVAKYTEEDMRRAFELGQSHGSNYHGNNFDRWLQSLQPTFEFIPEVENIPMDIEGKKLIIHSDFAKASEYAAAYIKQQLKTTTINNRETVCGEWKRIN